MGNRTFEKSTFIDQSTIQSIFKSFDFTVDEEKLEPYKTRQLQFLKALISEEFFKSGKILELEMFAVEIK